MDKKKILIVSRAFHPIIAPRSFRATELAKELSKQGHEVTVLTHKRHFDYEKFEQEFNLKINDFNKGRWIDIPGKNIISKAMLYLLNFLFLFPDIQLVSLLRKELKYYFDFDMLISIAVPYPVHWGVAKAKKINPKLCKTWIADCGDPFMGNKEKKIKKPFYFQIVEDWFCKKPDYITIPIQEAITAYPTFCKEKIRVIPQGFAFDQSNVNKNNINNSFPTFAYAGRLSKGLRDPSEFLDYLCTIDLPFKFIVFTKNINLLTSYKNKLANKLEIKDYLPRNQLLDELRQMDFLVNIENKNNVQSPSKLIDYAIVQKPVLSIKPFELNEQIVDEFLEGNYTNQFVIKNIEQYNIKNVAKQFLNLTQP